MSGKRANLGRDENGAAMLEFTAAAFTFFIILFGTIDFTQVYFKWNLATKATQLGARLAAVSNPVAANLATLTGTEAGALPGATMPAYDCICKFTGSTLACTGTVPAGATACGIGATGTAAFNTIFYGRGSSTGTICDGTGLNIGMCNILGGMSDQNGAALTPKNVTIRYQYTGLGYAGRPGGPVPTITVSLTGVSHNFTLVGGLAGITSVALPTFSTTVTGEDLAVAGS